jgi:cytidylate kinase
LQPTAATTRNRRRRTAAGTRIDVERTPVIVTVDGPAGSGKTTLGRRLALALGLPMIDTGLLYRGVAVAAVRHGVDATDAARAAALAARTTIEVNTDASAPPGTWSVRVDGADASREARDPQHATLLAELSRLPEVRAVLLQRQRDMAGRGAVAVGRDCGTVVYPGAPVKFFLEASSHVRAERRAEQLRIAGQSVDEGALEAEIEGRDALDTQRAVSPLRPAPDAHIIDTGRLGIEEMVSEALRICREAGLVAGARE